MVVYALEQRWEISRHYFENHDNVAERERKKETGIFIDKSKREKPKTVRTPRTLLLWQKVCVKRHQHQFSVVLSNWTFQRHHWDEFCIKTSVWRHTKFHWFRYWSQLTIQCVFASSNGPAIDLQKMPILAKKNPISQMKLILILAGM